MTDPEISDYDRVVTALKLEIDHNPDHAERILASAELSELLDTYAHWARVYARNPSRPGNPFNVALMGWIGLDTARRLPYVFRVLRPGGPDA